MIWPLVTPITCVCNTREFKSSLVAAYACVTPFVFLNDLVSSEGGVITGRHSGVNPIHPAESAATEL
jgi:hypothetical protein